MKDFLNEEQNYKINKMNNRFSVCYKSDQVHVKQNKSTFETASITCHSYQIQAPDTNYTDDQNVMAITTHIGITNKDLLYIMTRGKAQNMILMNVLNSNK